MTAPSRPLRPFPSRWYDTSWAVNAVRPDPGGYLSWAACGKPAPATAGPTMGTRSGGDAKRRSASRPPVRRPKVQAPLSERNGAPTVGPGALRKAQRRAAVPAITYPPELPVSQAREELAAAIRDHQVVIVAGQTGSGKTTQLPKICLELGRGVEGAIAHTQPRRLAARTVAQRIADELRVPLGGAVGYAVRFTDRSSPDTLVRLLTDGLLL